MKKLHAMCLGYNRPELIDEALTLFESHKDDYPIEQRVLFDPGFPLIPRDQQKAALEIIAAKHGWAYRKMPNRNVSENWKQAIVSMGLKDGDCLWGVDPDERPQNAGYLSAAMEVFNNDPACYSVQLGESGIEKVFHFQEKRGTANIMRFLDLVAWTVGCFDVGWMRRIDGPMMSLKEYGMVEHATHAACSRFGGQFYLLADYRSKHIQSPDEKYNEWKRQSAYRQTDAPFSTWLRSH